MKPTILDRYLLRQLLPAFALCLGTVLIALLLERLLRLFDILAENNHALPAVFRLVLSLEGTLSGEHGVGIDKRAFVAWEIDAPTLSMMHAVKRAFDPAGILNPGKALPAPPN